MQKFKGSDVKGIQIHDYREKESHTNLDIEKEKTKLNYDVLHTDPIDFKKKIDSEIEKRYTGKRTIRKDAVRLCEFIVTSDKTFFENLSPEDEKRFFKESVEFLQKRYGKENIMYGIVHKDEKTPHMHVGMVPITEDGRLAAKHYFGHKSELQGLQTDFHRHIKESGFDLERGEIGSDREHVKAQKYKAQTLKEEINSLRDDLSHIQEVDRSLKEIVSENREKRSMGLKMGLKGKETIEMPKENYEMMYAMASRSYDHAKNANTYKEKYEESSKLLERGKAENKGLEQNLFSVMKENNLLKKEIKVLHKTVDYLKGHFKERQQDISKIVGYAKRKAIGFFKMSKYPKAIFNEKDENELVGKNDFENQRKITKTKSKDQGMEL